MFIAISYMYAQNHALKAFTALSRAELCMLYKLALEGKQIAFGAFYDELAKECVRFGKQQFIDGLNNLRHIGAITRTDVGNYALFNITSKGLSLLGTFNDIFDACVKEQIMKHGNGL